MKLLSPCWHNYNKPENCANQKERRKNVTRVFVYVRDFGLGSWSAADSIPRPVIKHTVHYVYCLRPEL